MLHLEKHPILLKVQLVQYIYFYKWAFKSFEKKGYMVQMQFKNKSYYCLVFYYFKCLEF